MVQLTRFLPFSEIVRQNAVALRGMYMQMTITKNKYIIFSCWQNNVNNISAFVTYKAARKCFIRKGVCQIISTYAATISRVKNIYSKAV